ncbi:glycosyltransferase [Campylobacter lari]|nr:glycosyltransferase [Campylobacter lari]
MISILTPCFNHEKYIKYFIQSILEQSFENFELIIVDDCSSDDSIKEIQKFNDSRIKLIKHDFNQGINGALNTAFENSSGDYIVFCASDDMLEKNALEKIYQIFNSLEVDVIYPSMSVINDENIEISKSFITQRSNLEALRYLFFKGNCFFSPGMAVKKEVFKRIYPLPNALCNHQDTQMHISLLTQKAKINFSKETLVKYRIRANEANISAPNASTKARENLEIELLMDSFLKIQDIEFLKEIFKDEIKKLKIDPFENTIEFFLGRMAIESQEKTRKYWGYHKIMHFYNDKNNVKILLEKYNFTFKDLLSLSILCDDDRVEKKYKKYKKLFNYSLIFSSIITLMFICILLLG